MLSLGHLTETLVEFGFIDVEVLVEEKRLMALKESKGSDDPICPP